MLLSMLTLDAVSVWSVCVRPAAENVRLPRFMDPLGMLGTVKSRPMEVLEQKLGRLV
jgi:hypothetical protein